jgi:hypothetical protein
MHGPCKDCSLYRIARPPSELLANAMASNDTAVLTALGKIQEDEKELDAQEDMFRARLDQRGQTAWGMRPMMSSYCGLEEQAGVFHVAEIRNRGLQCEQFTTTAPPAHDCSTCAHRVVPDRVLDDVKQEQAYAAMSSGKAATGNSASMIENLWKEHLQSSANRRANEVRDTYQRKGVLATEPNYLDYCRSLSRDQRFVVCVLQNPHGTCASWSPAAVKEPPVSVPAAAAAPTLAAFDVAALFTLGSDEPEAVPSPLRGTVEDFIDFAGCVLGITFADRQIASLRTALVTALSDRGGDAARLVASAVESFQEVKSVDPQTRHAWRQRHQETYLQQLGRAQDPVSRLLSQWQAEARHVLAPGAPPLTREAAESWIELTAFASTPPRDGDPDIPPPSTLEADIARLAQGYTTLSFRQQSVIALAPITLYELRRAWPGLTPDQRRAAMSQLATQLGTRNDRAAATPAIQPQAPAAPSTGVSREMAQPAASDVPGSTLDRLTREFAEAQARGDHQKVATLQVQIQMELQKETARLEMESNIAKMYHQMSMGIIGNMK